MAHMRRRLRLHLWVAGTLALGCMLGCDALYAVRMDVRSGGPPMVTVVDASQVDRLAPDPIEGAAVTLWPSWSGAERSTLHSGADGSLVAQLIVGGFVWQRASMDQLEVRFSCTRHGYASVEGTFRLAGFLGDPERHRQTVLVVMEARR